MNANQMITILGILVAILAVFVEQVGAHAGLVLVVLGLISGFMNPVADMAGRMAYTVAQSQCLRSPILWNQLGAPLNAIIDHRCHARRYGRRELQCSTAVKDSATGTTTKHVNWLRPFRPQAVLAKTQLLDHSALRRLTLNSLT